MNEVSPPISNKERLQNGADMVMVVDFNISGVGGAEKSAKAIWRYGEKADAKWTLISPYDVDGQLPGDTIKIDCETNPSGGLPQDHAIAPEQVSKISELLKEKNPQRIILIQPRGMYMRSIVDSLTPELLSKTAARWGSALDGPIVKKPDESDSEYELRKESQREGIRLQAEIANKIGVNLAISDAIRDSLVRAGVDPLKIKKITNQVGEGYSSQMRENDANGEFRAKYLDSDELGVLVASRVVRHKGLDWLIGVFVELNKKCQQADVSGSRYKKIRIALVGDPKDQTLLSELQSMEKYTDLSTRFTYMGSKTSEEMNELYNAYDILFHPSPSEGGPRVIPEAAKGGMMPIARIDCDGARELITSGSEYEMQIGLLIQSPEEAASQIFALMNNPDLLSQFQSNAHSWANKKFDPQRIEQEFWTSLGLVTE